jgi:hypothetical protein
LYKYLSGLRNTRAVLYLLLAGLPITTSYAQETHNPGVMTASGSSTSPSSNTLPPDQRVILKVGGKDVTQAAFETMIRQLEAQQGPADLTRQALGDNYASLLMLSQQAVAHHLESSPEVLEQLAIDRTQILSNAEFARLKSSAKPTTQEISAYYAAHLDDYDTVQLRRLFIWTKPKGAKDGRGLTTQEAKALVAAVRQASAAGSDPRNLVPKDDSVVLDMDPLSFQRGELPAQMDTAAFSLTKEGEWVQLDNTPDGMILLQLVKRGRRDLKEVSPSIEKKLESEKLRAELDELKKKSGIWMDQEYFASKAPLPPASTQPDASGPSNAIREDKDAAKPKK